MIPNSIGLPEQLIYMKTEDTKPQQLDLFIILYAITIKAKSVCKEYQISTDDIKSLYHRVNLVELIEETNEAKQKISSIGKNMSKVWSDTLTKQKPTTFTIGDFKFQIGDISYSSGKLSVRITDELYDYLNSVINNKEENNPTYLNVIDFISLKSVMEKRLLLFVNKWNGLEDNKFLMNSRKFRETLDIRPKNTAKEIGNAISKSIENINNLLKGQFLITGWGSNYGQKNRVEGLFDNNGSIYLLIHRLKPIKKLAEDTNELETEQEDQ